jgi:hypothetical protein
MKKVEVGVIRMEMIVRSKMHLLEISNKVYRIVSSRLKSMDVVFELIFLLLTLLIRSAKDWPARSSSASKTETYVP